MDYMLDQRTNLLFNLLFSCTCNVAGQLMRLTLKSQVKCLPVFVVERLLGAEEVEQLLNVTEAWHEDQHRAVDTAVLW